MYLYQLSQLFTYTSVNIHPMKLDELTSVLNFFKAATDFSGEFASKFCKTDSISKRLNNTHTYTYKHKFRSTVPIHAYAIIVTALHGYDVTPNK